MSSKMKAGGGFIQNVQGSAGISFGQFPGQFDPLGFPAGKGGGGLSQLDIPQPHLHEGVQNVFDGRNIFKKIHGLTNGKIQHIRDGVTLVQHFQGGFIESSALADFTGNKHIRPENASPPGYTRPPGSFRTARP